MSTISLNRFNNKNSNINLPKTDIPVSVSEKLVRDEVKKLTENAEEIKKLKEQIKRRGKVDD